MWYIIISVVVFLWLLFNWASPFALLQKAHPLSRSRLPAELLDWDKDAKVKFYVANLIGGAALGIWAPPMSIIIFDKTFLTNANAPLLRFVIAHELAHFNQGHHRKRWLAVVSLAFLFPAVRRWLARMEDEADIIAEAQTGRARKQFPQLRVS